MSECKVRGCHERTAFKKGNFCPMHLMNRLITQVTEGQSEKGKCIS